MTARGPEWDYRTKSWEFGTTTAWHRRRGRLTFGVPVYATRVLCEVANERGIATSDVLAGTGIAPADLDNPEAVVAAVGRDRRGAPAPDRAARPRRAGHRRGQQVPADPPRPVRVRGDVVRDVARALRRLDALLLADHAEHRREAVRGRRHAACWTSMSTTCPPMSAGFFLERDVAGIVMTVSDFALPVVAALRRSGTSRR